MTREEQHEQSCVAELVTRLAEVEHDLDQLQRDIDEHLPAYVLDDDTGDEASHRERIEYAGDELRHLRARVRGLEIDPPRSRPPATAHAFAGDDADCSLCGRGSQYHLHTDLDASEEE